MTFKPDTPISGRLDLAWIVMGFSSMIGQVVLLRECLVVFSGNEASLGIMLACWLFWVGVGSLFLGKVAEKVDRKIPAVLLCQLLLAVLLPIVILLTRASKGILGISTGEIVGLAPIVFISAVLLAPVCLILGLLFALGCQFGGDDHHQAARHIGRIYVLEALGSMAGGAVFSYILIRFLNSFQIAWLLSLLNLISALTLARVRDFGRRRMWTGLIGVLVCATLVYGAAGVERLQRLSLAWQWSGFDVVYSKDSIYGNITVTERQGQEDYFESGLHMFSYPDRQSAEELAHMTLLQHPDPKQVLLVGGGVNGSLAEILKHPVDHVTYVELDPHIVNVARAHMPHQDLMLDSPRVSILHLDGRLYIRQSPAQFDVITVNLPEPFTTQLNRFYTVEFFREAKRLLKPNGIFSFRVTSSEDYISDELAQLLGSFSFTLRQVFPSVEVIPGATNIFLACSSAGVLTSDPDVITRRIRERSIETAFISEYYLPYRMAAGRMDQLRQRLAGQKPARLNTDFHPISSFYDMIHWTAQFRLPMAPVLRSLSRLTFGGVVVSLVILTMAGFMMASRSGTVRRCMLLVAVGTTGAMGIIVEVIILLAFQVLYGYVYAKVGILLTGFMVGLALGGAWMTRRLHKGIVSCGNLLRIQAALCLYPLVMLVVFKILMTFSNQTLVSVSAELLFPLLIASCGFLVGAQFPLASALYMEQTGRTGSVGGTMYGIDLLGSSLGALTAGSILIPVLGIWNMGLLLSVLGLSVFILLLPGTSLLQRRG